MRFPKLFLVSAIMTHHCYWSISAINLLKQHSNPQQLQLRKMTKMPNLT